MKRFIRFKFDDVLFGKGCYGLSVEDDDLYKKSYRIGLEYLIEK